jgi:hypothetical protein
MNDSSASGTMVSGSPARSGVGRSLSRFFTARTTVDRLLTRQGCPRVALTLACAAASAPPLPPTLASFARVSAGVAPPVAAIEPDTNSSDGAQVSGELFPMRWCRLPREEPPWTV